MRRSRRSEEKRRGVKRSSFIGVQLCPSSRNDAPGGLMARGWRNCFTSCKAKDLKREKERERVGEGERKISNIRDKYGEWEGERERESKWHVWYKVSEWGEKSDCHSLYNESERSDSCPRQEKWVKNEKREKKREEVSKNIIQYFVEGESREEERRRGERGEKLTVRLLLEK